MFIRYALLSVLTSALNASNITIWGSAKVHLNYLLKMIALLNIVWVKMHYTALFRIVANLTLDPFRQNNFLVII